MMDMICALDTQGLLLILWDQWHEVFGKVLGS